MASGMSLTLRWNAVGDYWEIYSNDMMLVLFTGPNTPCDAAGSYTCIQAGGGSAVVSCGDPTTTTAPTTTTSAPTTTAGPTTSAPAAEPSTVMALRLEDFPVGEGVLRWTK